MADTDASVFNTSNITLSAAEAQDFTNDAMVPIKEGIGKGDIRSPGFLTGINAGFADDKHNGIDQTVIINGDQIAEIKGNQYEKVHIDRGTHIVGKEELKVDDERKTEVKKDDSLKIIGNYDLEVKEDAELIIAGALTHTVFGPVLGTIIGSRVNNEVAELVEFKGIKILQIGVASVSINLLGKAEIFGAATDVGLLHRAYVLNHDQKELIEIHNTLIQTEQRIFAPHINLIVVEAGGPYIHGIVKFHA
jgi:Gp5-like OB domain-containing protein